MSQITTHVLDTTKGKPAAGIKVSLYRQAGSDWPVIATGITDKDGRITGLLEKDQLLAAGVYKMDFFTRDYFTGLGQKSFYPQVPVVFEITSGEHYHIPLLLGPFGYTTYRGS